jgi:hypothetical protein
MGRIWIWNGDFHNDFCSAFVSWAKPSVRIFTFREVDSDEILFPRAWKYAFERALEVERSTAWAISLRSSVL